MFKQGFLRAHPEGIAVATWLGDLAVVVLSYAVVDWLFSSGAVSGAAVLYGLFLACLLTSLIFPAAALYRTRRGEILLPEIRVALLANVLVFVTVAFLLTMQHSWLGLAVDHWFYAWWALCLSGQVLYRLAGRSIMRWLRSSGYNRRFVVVVGDPASCARTRQAIECAPWSGFRVVRVFDGELSEVWPSLQRHLARSHVDQVWLTMPLRSEQWLYQLADKLSRYVVDVRYVPDARGMLLLGSSTHYVAGLHVVNLSEAPIDGFNRFVKEIEDRVLAAVFLLLLAPLMALIALGVKLSSPGPVFYRQERLGVNSVPIRMFKFRSMPVGVEGDSGPVWNRRDQNRATPFGSFLRKSSLDELPQLFNVLLGEMSIVGPRPERPVFVEQFKDEIPGYMQKHRVKAGITGWAQINGWRGDTDLRKRIEHDLYYIQHWSLLFDLKIILLTITRGLVNKNAC